MLADKLLNNCGFEIIRFADLPATHQKAIIWYMSIDGEAWSPMGDLSKCAFLDYKALKVAVEAAVPEYVAMYGNIKFGVSTIPTDLMRDAIATSPSFLEAYPSMAAFTAAMGKAPSLHSASDRWPSILSSFDDEILQDGWKRCYSYMSDEHPDIPVIFYPESYHLARAAVAESLARTPAQRKVR